MLSTNDGSDVNWLLERTLTEAIIVVWNGAHKQSLLITHNSFNAVLMLNITDGSAVNWLYWSCLLRWNKRIRYDIPQATSYHSQYLQCRIGTEYTRWECCQLIVIKVPFKVIQKHEIWNCTHKPQNQSLLVTHKTCSAVLVLNMSDGTVVKLLL